MSAPSSLPVSAHFRPTGWWSRLWQPFWAVPLWLCLAAFALGVGLPAVDGRLEGRLMFVFPGGADGARAVLGAIGGSMISVMGLVFSITLVILQQASSQYTPRVLGAFLRNRITQFTLGTFAAAFVYSLTVLRSVRGEAEQQDAFVPALSVSVAFLVVIVAVGLFIAFIHHITTTIQVTNVVARIADHTLTLIRRDYPAEPKAFPTDWSPSPGEPRCSVEADGHGSLVGLDYRSLVETAAEVGTVLVLERRLGDYVVEGQPLVRAWGVHDLDEAVQRRVLRCLALARERTQDDDVAFGFRQLVDVADRALSPGVNDPTTAVQVVDQLHVLLRDLVRRAEPDRAVADGDGVVRLVHQPHTVDGLVDLAVGEILHYGSDNLPVPERLLAMVEDLHAAALPRYRPTLKQWQDRLKAVCSI